MSETDWPEWRCPVHGSPLDDHATVLSCPRGDAFPRRRGIPRFLESPRYAQAFAPQWARHRLTQLDSHTGLTLSRDRARRCLGEDLWHRLDGAQVLECGCGAGRFTEVLMARDACVTSIDISEAVDVNQESFPQGERHRIAQADILKPPFAPQQFDIVFCLGVVQHTPSPEQTMASLYDQVKPGGAMVLDHYTYRVGWFLGVKPLLRPVFRRLPPGTGLRYTERFVDLLLPLHARAGRWSKLLNRVSPVWSFYRLFPELSEADQREWALLDTHDGLTAWYMRFRTRSQIERSLQRLGAEEIHCRAEPGGVVEARAWRPVRPDPSPSDARFDLTRHRIGR
jgi:2-polyprenyl-3-methyl-5-hydroxy-6-metoxy-1,4-benzoquinol methylase